MQTTAAVHAAICAADYHHAGQRSGNRAIHACKWAWPCFACIQLTLARQLDEYYYPGPREEWPRVLGLAAGDVAAWGGRSGWWPLALE
jgi:hypothetical protein